ncbi:MAG: M55 family metallopeptidase [Armatimonadota bacterium]|nr:M55 family metallopeptidase [Armatimonadota bacterium]
MTECRVFISADIEGVAGIATTLQTSDAGAQYQEGRQLMTDEVSAAIAGAFDGGATAVVVCDSHAGMQNLIPSRLDERAVLIRGAMRDSLQMEGLDASYHAVFITGTHARAGTADAVLDHTWNSATVHNLRINGRTMNEAGLNGLVAGRFGVPVTLVTGDRATVEQTREFLPDAVMVAVKESRARGVVASLHPAEACRRIRRAAAEAARRRAEIRAMAVLSPMVMEIDYIRTDMTQTAALVPGVERIGPRTVRVEADPDTIFRLQELLVYRLRYEL